MGDLMSSRLETNPRPRREHSIASINERKSLPNHVKGLECLQQASSKEEKIRAMGDGAEPGIQALGPPSKLNEIAVLMTLEFALIRQPSLSFWTSGRHCLRV